MVLMPVWIVENITTNDHIVAFLGSEPGPTADKETLPRSALLRDIQIVPKERISHLKVPDHLKDCTFAILALDMDKVPSRIQMICGYRK